MTQEETVNQLRDLIQRHEVCYEVWPENLVSNGQVVKIGFALELEGTHVHPVCRSIW